MATPFLLTPLPEPPANSRTVLVDPTEEGLFFRGPDGRDPNWYCGKCKAMLAEHVPQVALGGTVLKCGACGTFNDTQPTD